MQGDETYAADSLIDVGPAPPPPNKCEFDLGPPAGGQAAYPPQNPGFAYPPPVQPQGVRVKNTIGYRLSVYLMINCDISKGCKILYLNSFNIDSISL